MQFILHLSSIEWRVPQILLECAAHTTLFDTQYVAIGVTDDLVISRPTCTPRCWQKTWKCPSHTERLWSWSELQPGRPAHLGCHRGVSIIWLYSMFPWYLNFFKSFFFGLKIVHILIKFLWWSKPLIHWNAWHMIQRSLNEQVIHFNGVGKLSFLAP